jgi:TolA-binding protein
MRRVVTGRISPLFWTRIAICVLSLAAFAPVASVAAPEDDYNLAVGLYKKERWDEAAKSFQAFLKANPDNSQAPLARLYLGLALVNQGEYAPARDVLREFVMRYPKDKNLPDAMYRIGETSYSLEDYKQAEQDFLAFVDRFPDHELAEWALPYLADAELRLDKPAEAAKHFRTAIEKYPNGKLVTEAKFGLARADESLNKPNDAAKLYRELAAGNTPRAAASQLRVATLLYDAEKYAEAAKEFQALVDRFPQSPLVATARLNAGFALYRSGDFAKALEQLQAAAKETSQAAVATHWIGMVRKSQGDEAGAIEAFRSVVEKYGDAPIASDSLFQWADATLRSGDYAEAVPLFERVTNDNPKGEHAADAVYFAGEAALLAGELDKAAAFVDRFKQEYGQTAYRMYNRLLAGRVLEARAAKAPEADRKALEDKALAEYEAVLTETEVASTKAKASFQIARLYERRGEPDKAITALAPLLDDVRKNEKNSPYLDALIIAARAQLALNKPAEAIEAATQYLSFAPKGDQFDAAVAVRAVANLAADHATESIADWETLRSTAPKSNLLIPTTRDLAERAYAKQDWERAAIFFAGLGELALGQPAEAAGLSGLGWSLHKAGKFAESAAAFDRVLQRFGDAPQLAPEAAYMKGKALQDAGDLAAAADAYRTAFERFAPKEPAASGDETSGLGRHAYLAGLQLARVLRLQHKAAESDAAYAALNAKYPKPRNLDELLDEWALLHYEAGDYAKSDALFRRIIAETPQSPLVANAKLSLAESDLFGGRLDEAKAAFQAIAGNDKASPAARQRALSLLVSLAAERMDWKTAESLARDYLDRFPEGRERSAVLYQLGEAQLQLGQPEKAAETLSQVEALASDDAVSSEPWFPRVWILLAEAAFQKKDYATATQHLEKVAAMEPKPEYAYLADELLGRVYKNQAKFNESRAALERVLNDPNARRTSTAARAQYEIAQTYYLQERWEEARTAAFKVYTLYKFPEWQAPALFMAGLSDEALGERQKAASAFADVVKEFPETQYAQQAREKLAKLGKKNG